MDEIFNNEKNSFSLITLTIKEEDNSIISKIYINLFPNAYSYYKTRIFPDLISDKIISPPLSGIFSNSHKCCYVIQMSYIKGYLYLNKLHCSFIQDIYNKIFSDEKKLKADEDYNGGKKCTMVGI